MRNSGKTYRAVLSALFAASEGRSVIHLSPTASSKDLAARMGTALVHIVSNAVVMNKDKITFKSSNGSLKFLTLAEYEDALFQDRLRGLKIDKIIEDLN